MSDFEITEEDLIVLPKDQVDRILEFQEETVLTPEEENHFLTLISIGKEEMEVEFFGHTALIRTLTTEEEIELGRVLEEYQTLPTRSRAYNSILVAAYLCEVDGEVLYTPMGPKEKVSVAIRHKFNTVKEWSPSVVDFLFSKTEDLDAKAKKIWEKLGKD